MRHRLRRGLYGSVAALGGSFTPLSLFSAGEQGFWYDPSDFSTLFQDTAGTVPVTAVGQSVARINDKSGRGNHATQSNASQQPILLQDAGGRYYLYFDGTDDFLVTGTITPGTDKVQVFAGVRKLSDAAQGILLETGYNVVDGGISWILPSSAATPGYRFTTRGTATSNAIVSTGYAAPITNVLTGLGDIAGDSAILRTNATQAASSTSDQGTGDYLAYPLYIGRRGGTSLPFNGRIYQLICRFGSNLTAAQIEAVERWVASKTGVVI